MTNTVTVLCRLPHGLWLESGYELSPTNSQIKYGPNYRKYKLNGACSTIVRTSPAILPPNLPDNLPGVTEVPADFMEHWLREHADIEYVKNGLISIVEKRGDVAPASADLRQQPTGVEPVDPNKMPAGMKKGDVTPAPFT